MQPTDNVGLLGLFRGAIDYPPATALFYLTVYSAAARSYVVGMIFFRVLAMVSAVAEKRK